MRELWGGGGRGGQQIGEGGGEREGMQEGGRREEERKERERKEGELNTASNKVAWRQCQQANSVVHVNQCGTSRCVGNSDFAAYSIKPA